MLPSSAHEIRLLPTSILYLQILPLTPPIAASKWTEHPRPADADGLKGSGGRRIRTSETENDRVPHEGNLPTL
ncbi:MAG: hypothetical protein OJF50_001840 [Nitrospira sp.]|nr:hypothetical protein [Nitrospira sp.]